MAPSMNKYKSISMLVIFFLICMTFFSIYYFSNSGESELFQRVRESKANTDLTEYSKVFRDTVVLVKDNGVVVNDCRLVFKGFQGKFIYLDLFLLELDPQYAYHQKISKASAIEGIRLGDFEYRLISVSKKTLKLKIHNLYKTL